VSLHCPSTGFSFRSRNLIQFRSIDQRSWNSVSFFFGQLTVCLKRSVYVERGQSACAGQQFECAAKEFDCAAQSVFTPQQTSSYPNTAHLLAEVEALKARCAMLENIALLRHTPQLSNKNVPVTSTDASSHTQLPTPILSNNNYNAAQGLDAKNFQWMTQAAGHDMNTDLNPVKTVLSPDPVPASHQLTHVDEALIDEDLQNWFDFDSSTFPSDPSTNPTTQGASFEASILDDSASSADGPTSILGHTSSVASRRRLAHHCAQCMKSYSRPGDLRRHARSHNPNAPRFSCPQAACGRQFLRMDKLKDHRVRRGH